MKLRLKKTIGRATVTCDELTTILTELKSVINARPITYVYDDVESVSYALITAMPNGSHHDVASMISTLSRRAQHQRNVLQKFITQWL